MKPAEILQMSDDRELWHRGALQMWRWGFEAGRAYQQRQSVPMTEQLDFDPPGDYPVRALGPLPAIDPELDRIRYPPHGRKRFAEPRPGDYTGGPVPWTRDDTAELLP